MSVSVREARLTTGGQRLSCHSGGRLPRSGEFRPFNPKRQAPAPEQPNNADVSPSLLMHQPTPPSSGDSRSLAELAAASAAGDRGAFSALHKRLSGGLRRLFLDRAGNKPEVADDLLQRTWIGVWQSLSRGRYDPSKSAISTFVYAVAHKMWLQHLRSTGGSARAFGGDDPPLGAVEAPGSAQGESDLAEVLDAIRACLRGQGGDLTTDEREILRLSGAGASDRDLAAKLGVSPSTANARKRAAFEKLRRHLATAGHRWEAPERIGKPGE